MLNPLRDKNDKNCGNGGMLTPGGIRDDSCEQAMVDLVQSAGK